jgi:hypothetical protein
MIHVRTSSPARAQAPFFSIRSSGHVHISVHPYPQLPLIVTIIITTSITVAEQDF